MRFLVLLIFTLFLFGCDDSSRIDHIEDMAAEGYSKSRECSSRLDDLESRIEDLESRL